MDAGSKTAIFYITNNGLNLAQRLRGLYPEAQIVKFKSEVVYGIWDGCKNLIFIMAAGIVVRTIAPLIKDKKTDPAVVVLDEKGEFAISLLSGHLGGANEIANEIAKFLGGEPVITAASDVNSMTSIDLWARENNLVIEDWGLVPQIGTLLLNNDALRVYIEEKTEDRTQNIDIKLPEEFLEVSDPQFADVLITNKKEIGLNVIPAQAGIQLYLRPKNLIVGIGCNSGTSANEIEDSVKNTLEKNNLSFLSIHSIATIDKKGTEPGLKAFAEKYSLKINTFTPDELNSVIFSLQPSAFSISDTAFKATGARGVAEPAALLSSDSDKLLVPKQKIGNVTVAVAELVKELKGSRVEGLISPILYIVGTGPGGIKHITLYAQDAIRKSDVIVGYSTYLDLINEIIKDKEVISTGMTEEVDRCQKAVELAISGKTVSLISGGDPGIYAMAGLVFEIVRGQGTEVRSQKLEIEVVPGVSALNACAARLGAPLMHDFASISLSDRLTPWEVIEKRLEAAAMADFVIVLYNPKSLGRPEHINKARNIILKYRSPEIPVGIVKTAMREGEKVVITDLKNMLNHDVDMQTTVIIGNSKTFIWDGWMVTPRGYAMKG